MVAEINAGLFASVWNEHLLYAHPFVSDFAVSYIGYLKKKKKILNVIFLKSPQVDTNWVSYGLGSTLIVISPCFFCAGPLLVPQKRDPQQQHPGPPQRHPGPRPVRLPRLLLSERLQHPLLARLRWHSLLKLLLQRKVWRYSLFWPILFDSIFSLPLYCIMVTLTVQKPKNYLWTADGSFMFYS